VYGKPLSLKGVYLILVEATSSVEKSGINQAIVVNEPTGIKITYRG
jgi:hypothetical protein